MPKVCFGNDFFHFNEQTAEQNIFHQNQAAGPKTSEIWINLKVFDAKLGFGRHSCLVFTQAVEMVKLHSSDFP